MFNTTGQVHYSGIQNEHDSIKLLNEWAIYSEEVKHFGGTKQKEDAKAGKQGISIKHKKGLKSGSFDWVNTSNLLHFSHLTEYGHFDTFNTWVRVIRNSNTDIQQNTVDVVRDEFNKVCHMGLKTIGATDLQNFVIGQLFNDLDLVINDSKAGVLYHMPTYGLRTVQLIERGFQVEAVPSDKISTSRKLVLRSGVYTVDTGLRLRLTSNNGIKAMLGISKANKTSVPVLKLQQDNVERLVNSADPLKMWFYNS